MQVVALDGLGLRDFVKHQERLREGTHLDLPGVTSASCTRLEVRVPEGAAPARVECDGEVVGTTPFAIQLQPSALQCCL